MPYLNGQIEYSIYFPNDEFSILERHESDGFLETTYSETLRKSLVYKNDDWAKFFSEISERFFVITKLLGQSISDHFLESYFCTKT